MLHEVISRIRQMEQIYDFLGQTLAEDPNAAVTEEFRKAALLLTQYYESGEWLRHYTLDEKGLLPRELKRGVLSQDGVFDLLETIGEMRE